MKMWMQFNVMPKTKRVVIDIQRGELYLVSSANVVRNCHFWKTRKI